MNATNQLKYKPTGDPLFPDDLKHKEDVTTTNAEEASSPTSVPKESHSAHGVGDPLLKAVQDREKSGFTSELHGHGDPVMNAVVDHWGTNSNLSQKGDLNLHSLVHEEFKKAGDPLFQETSCT